MDPLSRLPLECLQRILHAVADQKNRSYLAHLANLVRFNRYMALVTLPFLYYDPLKAVSSVNCGGIRTRALLCTLLASTPVADLHPALSFEFESDAIASPELDIPGFDYIHNVYNLDIITNQFRNGMQEATSKSRIKETDYTLKCLDSKPPAFIEDFQAKEFLLWCCHQDLESLSIPLSDITRYRHAIDRLPRLDHVRFILDVIYDNTPADGPTDRISRDDAMQAVVQFVEEHTRVFRGRLKTVEGAEGVSGIFLGNIITSDAQRQIYRLLPPIQQPKTISNNNWDQLMAHLLATDLAHVESICGATREQWRHVARESLQILPRCRSLKRLNTLALGKGTFAWAVQERRKQANSESGSLGGSDGGQGSIDDDDDDATSAIRQALYLDIQTTDREHSRDLSQADFLLPPVFAATTDVSTTNASTTPFTVSQGALTKHRQGRSIPTHIVVQSLSRLVLRGRWVVDDILLTHLLTGVFPKVKYVSMNDSEGLTLPSLIQVLRANLKLVKHFDTIEIGLSEPTAVEGAELGLYPHPEFKKDMKITFHYTLFLQSKEYFLLRDPSILAPPKSRE
ncbi:hypothetical protein KI688_007860 [Linnemannia hyalina]|uniref:Uncharacterized protein n=1 Tax=Linnemannia hyalina TaxID=64524 RepID=A0A9P7XI51_9FUNG|nr:hypothetical protein KI688_007860 [Linnemannia hyalina]